MLNMFSQQKILFETLSFSPLKGRVLCNPGINIII